MKKPARCSTCTLHLVALAYRRAPWFRLLRETTLPKATEVGLMQIQRLRTDLDALGAKDRQLVVATDGVYINKTLLPNLPDRVSLVGLCRREAKLYAPPSDSESRHGDLPPTPDPYPGSAATSD